MLSVAISAFLNSSLDCCQDPGEALQEAQDKMQKFFRAISVRMNNINQTANIDPESNPVAVIATRHGIGKLSLQDFTSILKQIDEILHSDRMKLPKGRNHCTFVIFNEKFFSRPVLDETEVDEYMSELNDFSTQHPNVICIPHFLYKTSKKYTFRHRQKALNTYLANTRVYFLHGRSKYAPSRFIGRGKEDRGIGTIWRAVNPVEKYFVPHKKAELGIQVKAQQSGSRIILRRDPFQWLVSESRLICLGELLLRREKKGYCMEANRQLCDSAVLYKFGTGALELCVSSAHNPHLLDLARILRKYLTMDICFDLTLRRLSISTNFPDETLDYFPDETLDYFPDEILADSQLHILQSDRIYPLKSELFRAFPKNTVVIQADPAQSDGLRVSYSYVYGSFADTFPPLFIRRHNALFNSKDGAQIAVYEYENCNQMTRWLQKPAMGG
jgi:hypothetical protein